MASELRWSESEVLDDTVEEPPSRTAWRRAVLPALLVAALLGWWGDAEVRDREHEALMDAIASTQTEANQADDLVWATLQYMQPTILSFDIPESLRQNLKSTVQHMANQGVADINAHVDAVADVRILPWHDDLDAARDAYLAYVALKVEGLEDFWGVGRDDLPAGRQLATARTALINTAPDKESAQEVRRILSRRT